MQVIQFILREDDAKSIVLFMLTQKQILLSLMDLSV